jgi:type VI secretion system protein ImpL
MIKTFIAGLLTLRGIISVIGVAAVSLLIWFGGPYIPMPFISDAPPLTTASNRIWTIVILLCVLIGVSLLRLWLARRANARMIKSLLDNDALAAVGDNRSPEEVDQIRERYETAMKAVADSGMADGKGQDMVMNLPWYIIVGPPGAGKTTILKNSGLEFPLAERLGDGPIEGIGGTRFCDWWFTDRAVLIDTAGRYTTQDSNATADMAAWRGFLQLIKTHRRRRPINGVILAISLSDVVTQSEAERKKHVEALRKRLQEINATFGMQVPTYVVITKCDLIAGFNEYFEAMDERERAQVWGMTFDEGDGIKGRLLDIYDERSKELAQTLEQRLIPRLHEERNLNRRGRIYVFPKEFAAMRESVGGFVAQVFRPSKFDTPARLRGIYFTSGTQEGTSFDRVLGAFGRNFGLTGRSLVPPGGPGKAFFINRLLTDVIFPEQGLVGINRKLERRLALIHMGAYAAAAVVLVSLAALWTGAYARSVARIEATQLAAADLDTKLQQLPPRPTYAQILPALDAARTVKEAAGGSELLAWLDGVGLSATPTLSPLTQAVYDRTLLNLLLPALAGRLEERLSAAYQATGEESREVVRDLLRSYLMLGDNARFDRSVVSQTARTESNLAFPIDQPRRAAIASHGDSLMTLLPSAVPLDRRLIDLARSRLTRTPRADQIYERLVREGAQSQRLKPINLATLAGGTSLQVRPTRQQATQTVIPGLYTREGFYEFTLPRLPILIREELGADWISGDSADSTQFQKLATEVGDRYVQDYVRIWQQGMTSVGIVRFEDMDRGLIVLQGLASPQSPLERLLMALKENTTLPPPGEQAAAAAGGAAGQAPPGIGAGLSNVVAAVAGRAADTAVGQPLGDGPWPGTRIGEPFKPLVGLLDGGGGAQAPVVRIRELISGIYGSLNGIANAPDPGQAAYQVLARRVRDPATDVFGQLRIDSALRPEPVRTIMLDLANAAWGSLLGRAVGYVSDAWRREVLPQCEATLFNRYPIYPGATEEMALKDFGDMFRPGGVIEEFFNKYMSPLVVDQRRGYQPARIDGVPLPLRPDGLAQFQRARAIRQAFFTGSGSAPGIKFAVRPGFMSPGVLRSVLSVDGKDIVYRHEQPRSYDLEWPTRTESSTVSVVLTAIDGRETRLERSGAWALFRLVDASGLAGRGASDQFAFTVGTPDGPRITYELKAASASNPFSLSVLRAFRCPDQL